MYFEDKFNTEIQFLARIQPTGGETTLGNFDHEAFWKQSVVNPNNRKERPPIVKVIPLLMFNRLESDNDDDTSFHHKTLICHNKPSTRIRCYTVDEDVVEEESEDEVSL